jgi:hypothetical protein
MIVHLYQCPPGEQSTQSASLGANELPRCSSGVGEWIAVDVGDSGPSWSPTMNEVAVLVGLAMFAWGVAWGFGIVIKFAFGGRA